MFCDGICKISWWMFTNGLMPPLHPTILNDIFWVSQDCGSMLHVCVYVEMAMFPPSVFVAFTSDWNVTLRLGPVSITENKKWSHSAKQDSCIEDSRQLRLGRRSSLQYRFLIKLRSFSVLAQYLHLLNLLQVNWLRCWGGGEGSLTTMPGSGSISSDPISVISVTFL